MRMPLLVILACALAALPAAALTTDEVVQLSRAGLTDDVLIAQIESDGSVFRLSAEELDALRRANVSESVLRAMIATASTASPVPSAEPAASANGSHVEAPAVAPEEDRSAAPGPGETVLVLRNEDRGPVSFAIDPASRIVEFTAGTGAAALSPGQARRRIVPSGVYLVRWRGEPKTYRVSTRPGEQTDLILLTIDAPDATGVRLRVLRNGRDFGSTTLRVAAREPAPGERPPRTTVLGPQPPGIVRETVVYPTPVYAPAPGTYDCQNYAPVAPGTPYVPYSYGTFSTSFHGIHHGPGTPYSGTGVYYGPGAGCGR